MEKLKDPAGIARHAIGWTWAWLSLKMVSGTASLISLFMLETRNFLDLRATLYVGFIASICSLILYVIASVLNLIWVYRLSAVNYRVTRGATTSPGWAVGWFFVPIAAWWKPFAAFREAWQIASNTVEWRTVSLPARVRLWWGLWLTATIVNGMILFTRKLLLGLDRLMLVFVLQAVSAVVALALTIVWVSLVRALTHTNGEGRGLESIA